MRSSKPSELSARIAQAEKGIFADEEEYEEEDEDFEDEEEEEEEPPRRGRYR